MDRRQALLLASALTASACDRHHALSDAANSSASSSTGKWKAGTHYEVLADPRPAVEKTKAVEVIEFFWYGCPHCYTFEPHLVLWNRARGATFSLTRVPAAWLPELEAHARLHYALAALTRSDLHHEVFDTIHRIGNELYSKEDTNTFTPQLAFAKAHGIEEAAFMRAYRSADIASQVERARSLALQYRVEHVPTLIVNGKYKTDPSRTAANENDLIQVVDNLVKVEAAGTKEAY